jgi:hypothetical protein
MKHTQDRNFQTRSNKTLALFWHRPHTHLTIASYNPVTSLPWQYEIVARGDLHYAFVVMMRRCILRGGEAHCQLALKLCAVIGFAPQCQVWHITLGRRASEQDW